MAEQVVYSTDQKSSRVKHVSGEVALDGTNPTPVDVAGKLRKVVSVNVTIRNATAPALGLSLVTYDIVGTVVNFYGWEPTLAADTTLVASTDTETISYDIVGY
jgi:hypothetical protein